MLLDGENCKVFLVKFTPFKLLNSKSNVCSAKHGMLDCSNLQYEANSVHNINRMTIMFDLHKTR